MRRGGRVTVALLGVLVAVVAAVIAGMWVLAGPSSSGAPAPPPAAVSSPSAGTPASRPALATLPDPRKRMLLGTFTALPGQQSTEASIGRQEAAMGRRYDLQATFYNWRDPFPDQGEAGIAAHGRIPLMTWYGPGRTGHSPFLLPQIVNGRQDAWILRQARAIKAFGSPVWLQPMIEMNGDWYRGYSGRPAEFIAAWRHIHHLFARAGVSNVVWVWTPNLGPQDWDRYYPGDAYVDVIGVDGFNNPSWGGWRSFPQLFGAFFAHYAGRKPLMVGETATNTLSGNAAAWISQMHAYLKNVAGPRYGVVAVCWFDTSTSRSGYDWRLDQTPAAWRAWLSLAHDPYFGGHGSPGGSRGNGTGGRVTRW